MDKLDNLKQKVETGKRSGRTTGSGQQMSGRNNYGNYFNGFYEDITIIQTNISRGIRKKCQKLHSPVLFES